MRTTHLRRPSQRTIATFLARLEGAAFSYPEVGASMGEFPPGYDHDHARVQVGEGAADFERARAALAAWTMFPASFTRIDPPEAPIEIGQTVAVSARAFGLWWLNAARIVYVIDEQRPTRSFGFAYGTIAGAHVESGEERFSIEADADGRVWYDVRSFSRPGQWITKAGYPLVRRLQRRFARESVAAMKAAVESR